jgi:HAD superfamily hydrolase (TIGR01549 family)
VTLELLADCDAILLDVDGTLVDSNYHHVLAWQRAFRANGLNVPSARIHSLIGMGGDMLVPEVAGEEFDRDHGDSARTIWREVFDSRLSEVAALPGADDLVRALADTGRPVVLASSAPREHIEHYLDLLDVRDLVTGWTTSDDVSTTKPAPDLLAVARDRVDSTQPVAIGDSPWDCRAAQQLEVTSIAVQTGGFTIDQLHEAGAAEVYPTLEALTDAVRREA